VKTSDFYYHLPKQYIAQQPVDPRDSSKLLVYDRKKAEKKHLRFFDLPNLLRADDLLVINQTRVIRARLFGKKVPTGGKAELLLLREVEQGLWESLVGGKGIYEGRKLEFENGLLAEVVRDLGGPLRQIRFNQSVKGYLEEIGEVPLPPYIQTALDDPERYQTVYAEKAGSAAAPTAGLHFTPELISNILEKGIRVTAVTLHIGLDTFAPVHEENPSDHSIHSEWCHLPETSANLINQTRRRGGRIIAVGTTSVRTLETAASRIDPSGNIPAYEGHTNLYILPGFKFQVVDCLITNFHLPESTLLMLVSAFCGKEKILELYAEAMEKDYRFYSFGDAMLLL
jgi:S-adenosylmethionine:tRNA ribosyltransferase-isomerase